jgi:uncharacterized membrane protein
MESGVPSVSPETHDDGDGPSPLLGIALGAALIAFGRGRRSPAGLAAGIAGAGVLAATLVPHLKPRASAPFANARPIDVGADFTVTRPVAAVFDFFRNFENFPLLGGVLHSVDDYDDGRSRWRVMGRGGLVEWDVLVTKYLPPQVIAWESVPDAPVESAGMVRFDAVDAGTTRIRVSLHYLPCTEAAARAFHPLRIRRPERRVRDAIGRVEDTMNRLASTPAPIRRPRFPLPEAPAAGTSRAPGDSPGDASSQP